MRVLLFEGLPGSGKTTTSMLVAERLRAAGVACEWSREEQRDHPVLGLETRRLHRRLDYDEICLARWSAFLGSRPSRAWVLEGCALQSAVRFMVEQCWPYGRISSYWARFEALAHEHDVAIVYLVHPAPRVFLQGHAASVRAAVWPKITAHVATTPAGRRIMKEGGDPSIDFWLDYRDVCDRLLAASTLPRLDLDIAQGWAGADDRVLNWLSGRRLFRSAAS
jgi:hypothetical protein